ncbi:MAG: peptidoglycan-binding protein, partial [Rhodobacteraceae bacterium]|nr:peptidoglycan-binding protein [Paracoccaceae bacterium]
MGRVLGLWALVAALWCWAPGAGALASTNWIQLEAKRTLPEAVERARVWANREADVGVLLLPSGWYGVALGPAPAGVAAARLQVLRDA